MTTMRIGDATLTTDHASSSYGLPVLVVNGVAHGPEDLIDQGFFAPVLAADIVRGHAQMVALRRCMTHGAIDATDSELSLISRFLTAR